jgi:hypothetical protein
MITLPDSSLKKASSGEVLTLGSASLLAGANEHNKNETMLNRNILLVKVKVELR